MHRDTRKVAIIGAGQVGMACAYALLNQRACDELVLVDIDMARAQGEALDLSHSLAFSPAPMRLGAGDYGQCADADIAICCAGAAQAQGETRLDLLRRNAKVYRQVVGDLMQAGFDGLFLVAVNPVDVLTRLICELSGFPPQRVIGSGTTLDTARLRFLLGEAFSLNPQNVHAYVMGEHGDTEFVPWSQAYLGTFPVLGALAHAPGGLNAAGLEAIADKVRQSAYEIIRLKGATSYAIGMALTRIVRAIFGDERTLLTVSTRLEGVYGQHGVFAGVPSVVTRAGVSHVLPLSLTDAELEKLSRSCQTLEKAYQSL